LALEWFRLTCRREALRDSPICTECLRRYDDR
jgi:hypothetical protein